MGKEIIKSLRVAGACVARQPAWSSLLLTDRRTPARVGERWLRSGTDMSGLGLAPHGDTHIHTHVDKGNVERA